MIMHIQIPSIVKTVYSNIFKDILEYSGILMQIQSHFYALNLGGKGRPPRLFFKIKKRVYKGPDYEVTLSKPPSPVYVSITPQ